VNGKWGQWRLGESGAGRDEKYQRCSKIRARREEHHLEYYRAKGNAAIYNIAWSLAVDARKART
jgi:hypothetical protein